MAFDQRSFILKAVKRSWAKALHPYEEIPSRRVASAPSPLRGEGWGEAWLPLLFLEK